MGWLAVAAVQSVCCLLKIGVSSNPRGTRGDSMRYLLSSAVALVLLFCGTSAADPLTVTSGTIVFTDEPGGFVIGGAGFDVGVSGWAPTLLGGNPNPPFDRCAVGCAPGTVIKFGTVTYGFSEDSQGYSGTVNGVTYPALFTTGEVTFNGPRLVAPSTTYFAEGPFTFQGNLSIFTDVLHTGPPVFAEALVGRGTATAIGYIPSDSSLFFFGRGDDLLYTFASPVPEPSTLLMLGSGLIGGVAALRKGRRWPMTRRPSLF
jgi:PEP-CTERM motif